MRAGAVAAGLVVVALAGSLGIVFAQKGVPFTLPSSLPLIGSSASQATAKVEPQAPPAPVRIRPANPVAVVSDAPAAEPVAGTTVAQLAPATAPAVPPRPAATPAAAPAPAAPPAPK